MSAETNPWVEIASTIVGVTVVVMVLVAAMWGAAKGAERAEKDARHRRKVLLRGTLLYVACAVVGIAEVVAGRAPAESLIGLPIAAFLAWLCWRVATRVKVPPT